MLHDLGWVCSSNTGGVTTITASWFHKLHSSALTLIDWNFFHTETMCKYWLFLLTVLNLQLLKLWKCSCYCTLLGFLTSKLKVKCLKRETWHRLPAKHFALKKFSSDFSIFILKPSCTKMLKSERYCCLYFIYIYKCLLFAYIYN